MFGIALSVAACLRAGTHVDIAWIVDHNDGEDFDPTEVVAITPGGGHLGSVLSGALDGQLDELAGIHGHHGRLVKLDISPFDAASSGVEPATGIWAETVYDGLVTIAKQTYAGGQSLHRVRRETKDVLGKTVLIEKENRKLHLIKDGKEFRTFDFTSPWEGTEYVLPGDEKA